MGPESDHTPSQGRPAGGVHDYDDIADAIVHTAAEPRDHARPATGSLHLIAAVSAGHAAAPEPSARSTTPSTTATTPNTTARTGAPATRSAATAHPNTTSSMAQRTGSLTGRVAFGATNIPHTTAAASGSATASAQCTSAPPTANAAS